MVLSWSWVGMMLNSHVGVLSMTSVVYIIFNDAVLYSLSRQIHCPIEGLRCYRSKKADVTSVSSCSPKLNHLRYSKNYGKHVYFCRVQLDVIFRQQFLRRESAKQRDDPGSMPEQLPYHQRLSGLRMGELGHPRIPVFLLHHICTTDQHRNCTRSGSLYLDVHR